MSRDVIDWNIWFVSGEPTDSDYMSLEAAKPVFEVSDKVRLKPVS